MKKVLFFAAVFALGMTALVSCSSKEGVDAANDESVVGATDGMDVIEESVTEYAPEDGMPGNIINDEAVPEAEPTGDTPVLTDEAADEGSKSLKDKAKEVVDKGVDKAKELGEKGVDKAKELGEKGVDKAKELGEKGVDKAKDLINKLK